MKTLWQKVLLLIVLSGWIWTGEGAHVLANAGPQAASRVDAYAIAVEDGEYIYLVGDAVNLSATLPPGSLNLSGGMLDLWVAKLRKDGTPVFQALIGGKADDMATSMAVRQGVIYILGETWSTDFPQAPGNAGENDAVVLALAADGGSILWARRFGGSDQDVGRAIALSGNDLYLTGVTWSQDFINGTAKGDADGFLARLDLTGGLQWIKVFGGRGLDAPFGLAAVAGGIWITGETLSPNLAGEPLGGGDIFALRFDASGGQQFAGLYGGSDEDVAYAAQLAPDGSLYLAGDTQSADLPGAKGQYGGGTDAFLIHLSADGKLLSTNYLGGPAQDSGMGLVVLPNGDVVVGGGTRSAVFPSGYSLTSSSLGGQDAFLARVSSAGELASITLQGGSGDDNARDMVVTSAGIALVGSFSVGTLPYLMLVPASSLPEAVLPTLAPPVPTATPAATGTSQPTETPLPTATNTPVESPTSEDIVQAAETSTVVSAETAAENTPAAEFSPTPSARAAGTTAQASAPTATGAAAAAANTVAAINATANIAAATAPADASAKPQQSPGLQAVPAGLWVGGGLVLAALGIGAYYTARKRRGSGTP